MRFQKLDKWLKIFILKMFGYLLLVILRNEESLDSTVSDLCDIITSCVISYNIINQILHCVQDDKKSLNIICN